MWFLKLKDSEALFFSLSFEFSSSRITVSKIIALEVSGLLLLRECSAASESVFPDMALIT